MMTQKYLNDLTFKIIGAAIEVHKELGPGLLESIYEQCLSHILRQNGHLITKQLKVPVTFRGLTMDAELRLDILVDECYIVEVKATEILLPVHEAQLMTYLKLLHLPKGILINFNCMNIFKEGQRTKVTEIYAQLPKGY